MHIKVMSITDVEKKLVVTNEERIGQDRGGGLRGTHKINKLR